MLKCTKQTNHTGIKERLEILWIYDDFWYGHFKNNFVEIKFNLSKKYALNKKLEVLKTFL